MSADVRERLVELVLGSLSETERRELERLVDDSADLRREVALITEALTSVAESLPPVAPSEQGRARLLRSLSSVDRFQPFVDEIARRFDLTVASVRALLAGVDDPAAWQPGPLPSLQLIHFSGGPRVAALDAGFVRVAAGTTFPRHRHLGPELSLVLEGTMRDGDRLFYPGDVLEKQADDVHEYAAGPDRDLVIMVAHSGIVPA
jgi:hypothetical protein